VAGTHTGNISILICPTTLWCTVCVSIAFFMVCCWTGWAPSGFDWRLEEIFQFCWRWFCSKIRVCLAACQCLMP